MQKFQNVGTKAQFLQQMFCNQNIQIKKEGKGTYQLKKHIN